jgi:hypothetical protein
MLNDSSSQHHSKSLDTIENFEILKSSNATFHNLEFSNSSSVTSVTSHNLESLQLFTMEEGCRKTSTPSASTETDVDIFRLFKNLFNQITTHTMVIQDQFIKNEERVNLDFQCIIQDTESNRI